MPDVLKMTTWRYRRDKRSLYKQRTAKMITVKEYFARLHDLKKKYLEYLKS